jgi:hypothetical protein
LIPLPNNHQLCDLNPQAACKPQYIPKHIPKSDVLTSRSPPHELPFECHPIMIVGNWEGR